jgi:hypothetical protein
LDSVTRPTPLSTLLLLENGANPDIQDNKGKTALMVAAFNGSCDSLKVLLQRGASIDLPDKQGKTALMIAVETVNDLDPQDEIGFRNQLCCVSRLLAAGANPTLRNNNGENVLDLAQNEEVIKLIRDYIKNQETIYLAGLKGSLARVPPPVVKNISSFLFKSRRSSRSSKKDPRKSKRKSNRKSRRSRPSSKKAPRKSKRKSNRKSKRSSRSSKKATRKSKRKSNRKSKRSSHKSQRKSKRKSQSSRRSYKNI